HLAGACLQMRRCLVATGKATRGLDHYIYIQFLPRQPGRIELMQNLDAMVVDPQRIIRHFNCAGECSMHRVMAGQMRVCLHIGGIIDRHDLHALEAFAFIQRAQHVAPDPAIAIDGDPATHVSSICYVTADISTARLLQPMPSTSWCAAVALFTPARRLRRSLRSTHHGHHCSRSSCDDMFIYEHYYAINNKFA